MRLAQLSMRFPPGPGGVERHVFEVSKRLVARGETVAAFASDLYREFPWARLDRSIPRDEVVEGIRVHRVPVWSLPGELHYPFFRGLPRSLSKENPELLHVHTYGTHHASVARRYGRSRSVPYVLTAHYHPVWSIHGGWLRHQIRSFYDSRLAAHVVGDAARVIVQSREEERLLRVNGFDLPPVEVVAPGYTPLRAGPPGEFRRRFRVEGPFVLFVGRLASNKGLVPLVRAFGTLRRHDPTAQLVLVGEDGGMRRAIEQEARRLGLSDGVRLLGFINDDSVVADAFREARLFALPSEYEAFGLVLLEALAQGTPVIASRVGGIPEFVEDGKSGILIPPEDADALAGALVELWGDEPRRKSLGDYGRDQIVPKYTWDRVVDRLQPIYREVVGG